MDWNRTFLHSEKIEMHRYSDSLIRTFEPVARKMVGNLITVVDIGEVKLMGDYLHSIDAEPEERIFIPISDEYCNAVMEGYRVNNELPSD